MTDRISDPQPLEHLQAGLIFLLDRYADSPCMGVAMAIQQQLEQILEHPLIHSFPEIRQQCARRLQSWRLRACRCDAGPVETPRVLH